MRCVIIPDVRGGKDIPKFKPEGAYRPIYDLRGMKFGDIEVLELASSSPVMWKCRCICGKELVRSVSDITRDWHGKSNSCGCKKQAFAKGPLKKYSVGNRYGEKHGDAPSSGPTSLYGRWLSMKQRCENPKNKSYSRYGERGIKVCKEWHDYEAFKRWAEQNGYRKDLSIDRIDVNGDYCPENCRWANKWVQAGNKRKKNAVGHVGVYKQGNKFYAGIMVNGVRHYKLFVDQVAAIKYREELEEEYIWH